MIRGWTLKCSCGRTTTVGISGGWKCRKKNHHNENYAVVVRGIT